MGAMDARRLELYELLKPKLEEEAARRPVLALPSEPDRLATKDDLKRLELATKDDLKRLELATNSRFDAFEARMDARFSGLENTLTRRMITIMGTWTILVGSTVGWLATMLR